MHNACHYCWVSTFCFPTFLYLWFLMLYYCFSLSKVKSTSSATVVLIVKPKVWPLLLSYLRFCGDWYGCRNWRSLCSTLMAAQERGLWHLEVMDRSLRLSPPTSARSSHATWWNSQLVRKRALIECKTIALNSISTNNKSDLIDIIIPGMG